ncbi:hypothetical protein C8A03DRAFT_47575 [Achaetomium macrosporum]|uniref:FAS1 domain-containing protein n=1 Tax=Achaetomium macrosporum TaxID=79813 RepID=A0AAN7C2G1_9PEZI|nr:hypothetical protein C8A03DRAFT_47575 [Achaetomium macrosporum]
MLGQHLIGLLASFAVPALGQSTPLPPLPPFSFPTVLEDNRSTEYAALIHGERLVEGAPDLIIYAATNAALLADNGTVAGNGTLARHATDRGLQKTKARFGAEKRSAPLPPRPPRRRPPAGNGTRLVRRRDELVPSRYDFITLLDGPAFVNLGPGVNQSIMEKRTASSKLPVVFSSLGVSIKVTGDDIPFDKGSFLPTFSPDQPTAPVRQHILADYPAYTPLLRDGDAYPTLGGGEVVVSVDDRGAVYLDGARILAGDAIITNGAVYTIGEAVLGSLQL